MSGGYWERDQKTGEVQTEECFLRGELHHRELSKILLQAESYPRLLSHSDYQN